ncbi:MAG: hypothetical protein K8S56_00380 [Candidatus Cloacimonetes bacterium]|nr:hypothetical protein [Candidatus Cloacimonadota bacterium]
MTQIDNTINGKIARSSPADFDVISDTTEQNGVWYAIQCYGAQFPNNTSGVSVNGTGKNISALNGILPDGDLIYGVFTRLTLTTGVLIAYKG